MALGANDKTGPCLELTCAYNDFYIDYWFDDSSFIALEIVMGANNHPPDEPQHGTTLKNWTLVSCY